MENTRNITKSITFLLILGLSLSVIFVYFSQERLFSRMTYGDISLGSERHIRSLSVLLLVLVASINIFIAKRKFLAPIIVSYFILLIYVCINYLLTVSNMGELTSLMSTRGIGPWLCFGLIFVSYDDQRYDIFKKFLISALIVISTYVIFNLVANGIGLYRGQSLAQYRVYATNLVWIAPFIFLILKGDEKLKYIRVFALIIGLTTALVTLTRSFILIFFLALVFDFFHTEKRTPYIIASILLGALFIFLILKTEAFSVSLDLLQKRATSDTRSDQLITFLEQVNFFDMVVGTGFESTWNFGGYSYAYLDNQWLLFFWWAGLIPFLVYFYLTAIVPFKMFIKKGQDYETKVECFVLVIWTLACAGMSIYSTMSVNFYFFIVCIIQGRILYKYSQNSEYR